MKFDNSTPYQHGFVTTDNRAMASYLRLVGETVPDIDNPKHEMFGEPYDFKKHFLAAKGHRLEDGYFTELGSELSRFGFANIEDGKVYLLRFAHHYDEDFGGIRSVKRANGKPVAELFNGEWLKPEGAPEYTYVTLPPSLSEESNDHVSLTLREFKELLVTRRKERGINEEVFPWEISNKLDLLNPAREYLGKNGKINFHILRPLRTLTKTDWFPDRSKSHMVVYRSYDGELFQYWDLNPDVCFEDKQPVFNSDGTLKKAKYANPVGASSVYIPETHPIVLRKIIERNKHVDCSFLEYLLATGIEDPYVLGTFFWEWFPNSELELWITEGAPKAQALMSNGMPAVGGAGMMMFCEPGTDTLRPRLAKLIGENTITHIILDMDSKFKTIQNNSAAQMKLHRAIAAHQGSGEFIKHEFWSRSFDAKAADDMAAKGLLDKIRSLGIGSASGINFWDKTVIDKRYLEVSDFADSQGSMMFVRSGMDTGKTTAISQLIDQYRQEDVGCDVVAMSDRRTLAGQQANKFGIPKLGKKARNATSGAACLDSVDKFEAGQSMLNAPTKPLVLILDEALSASKHEAMSSTAIKEDRTTKNHKIARKIIKSMISAGTSVFADAFLNDQTIDFYVGLVKATLPIEITQLETTIKYPDLGDDVATCKDTLAKLIDLRDNLESRVKVIENLASERKKHTIYVNAGQAPTYEYYQIIEAAKERIKMVIVSNTSDIKSKYHIRNIEREVRRVWGKGFKSVLIDAQSLDNPDRPEYDCLVNGKFDELVAKSDCVCFNAGTQSGISIDVKGRFEKMFIMSFQNGELTGAAQASLRLRDLEDVEVNYWISKNHIYDPKMMLPQDWLVKYSNADAKLKSMNRKDGGQRHFNELSKFLGEQSSIMVSQSNLTKLHPVDGIKALLRESWNVIDVVDERKEEIAQDEKLKGKIGSESKKLGAVRDTRIAETVKAIASADLVTEDERQHIVDQDGRTDEDLAKLDKYATADIYGGYTEDHVLSYKLGNHAKTELLALSIFDEDSAEAKVSKDIDSSAGAAYNYFDVAKANKDKKIDILRDDRVKAFLNQDVFHIDSPESWDMVKYIKENLSDLNNELRMNIDPLWLDRDGVSEKGKATFSPITAINAFFRKSSPLVCKETGHKPGSRGNQVKHYQICEQLGKKLVTKDKNTKWEKYYVPFKESPIWDYMNTLGAKCKNKAIKLNHRTEESEKLRELSIARGMEVAM